MPELEATIRFLAAIAQGGPDLGYAMLGGSSADGLLVQEQLQLPGSLLSVLGHTISTLSALRLGVKESASVLGAT